MVTITLLLMAYFFGLAILIAGGVALCYLTFPDWTRRQAWRLRRRCLGCGGARLGAARHGIENVHTATARRKRLCYDCARLDVHAQNYGSVL